jgi:hypothetical protein
MKEEFVFNEASGTGVYTKGGSGLTFAIEGYSAGVPVKNALSTKPDATITRFKDEKNPQQRNPNIKFWGDNNLWPNEAIDHVENNVLLSEAMRSRQAFHVGKGVYPFMERVENNKRIVEPVFDSEIEDFFDLNLLNSHYFPESAGDYEIFKIIAPELVLSRDRKKINRIFHQKTFSMRWENQNPQTMLTENVYFSDYWDMNPGVGDYVKRPALNPYYATEHLQQGKDFNYIFPCSLPSRRNRSYPLPSWFAIVLSKWLKISNAVPEVKDAIFTNQMILKYHVQIPYSYWPMKYKDWATMEQKERTGIVDTEIANLNTFLTDKKNSGKAFISGYGFDPITQREYPGFVISAIDDKLKEGAFIPDVKEAALHIAYGTGMHTALMGVNIAEGQGGGSGSDIREAYLLQQAKMGIDRFISLSPIDYTASFNGWKKRLADSYRAKFNAEARLKFGYMDIDTTMTQDKNPSGKENKLGGETVDKNKTNGEKN